MDLCPFASYKPILVNYTPGRAGRAPLLIVDHIADGYGGLWNWFSQDRGDAGSSAHFWVSRIGTIEQYRPLSDTCWANGPVNRPDMSNPIIAYLVNDGYVRMNSVTVAIEHEGRPADGLTEPQILASIRLHNWLSSVCGIPLDRTHVVGHYQIDGVNRANCPGPKFPWARILTTETEMAFDIRNLRDRIWVLAAEADANGYPWLATALRAVTVLSKGER